MEQQDDARLYTPEEALEKIGYAVQPSRGHSMMPFIHPGDTIIVGRKKGRIKKFDIVLYKASGQYVIHRCVAVRERDYVMAGDHNTFREPGITNDMILGVVVRILRGTEKEIPMEGWRYRLYCHLRVHSFPIRCLFHGIRGGIASAARRLIRRKTR